MPLTKAGFTTSVCIGPLHQVQVNKIIQTVQPDSSFAEKANETSARRYDDTIDAAQYPDTEKLKDYACSPKYAGITHNTLWFNNIRGALYVNTND